MPAVTLDPFAADGRASLLSKAQELAKASLRAEEEYRRQQEEKQRDDAARMEKHRQQQRLFRFMRGPAEGETHVTFAPQGEAGDDAACCGKCAGLLADRSTQLAVVVCHPWGPLGGTMRDVCVSKIVDIFTEVGVTTLRFNFRTGLGRGHSAADDVRGACALLRGLDAPPRGILLVGYSYGACVVADVADAIDDVAAFVMISPPLGAASGLFLCRDVMRRGQTSPKPKLALMGDRDQFCTERRFTAFALAMARPNAYHVVTDDTPAAPPCCHAHGHGHGRGCSHAQRVHHFNVYSHVSRYLLPWVAMTFGVPFAEQPVETAVVVVARLVTPSSHGGTHWLPAALFLSRGSSEPVSMLPAATGPRRGQAKLAGFHAVNTQAELARCAGEVDETADLPPPAPRVEDRPPTTAPPMPTVAPSPPTTAHPAPKSEPPVAGRGLYLPTDAHT